MPKQIKKKIITPKEKVNAISGMIAMCAAVLMCVLMLIFVLRIKNESTSLAVILVIGYVVFLCTCVFHLVTSVRWFKDNADTKALFHGFAATACILFCLFNLRFVLIMLFSVFKLENATKNLLGSKSLQEFLLSQGPSWVCLGLALVIMIIVGVASIVKLASKK